MSTASLGHMSHLPLIHISAQSKKQPSTYQANPFKLLDRCRMMTKDLPMAPACVLYRAARARAQSSRSGPASPRSAGDNAANSGPPAPAPSTQSEVSPNARKWRYRALKRSRGAGIFSTVACAADHPLTTRKPTHYKIPALNKR